MQNRTFDRICVELDVMYYCGTIINSGIITNISENGLFIHTKLEFPFNVNFELIMPSNTGILNFPVEISRLEKHHGRYNGIGVRIADPSPSYLAYIGTLRTSRGSPG